MYIEYRETYQLPLTDQQHSDLFFFIEKQLKDTKIDHSAFKSSYALGVLTIRFLYNSKQVSRSTIDSVIASSIKTITAHQ
ncbi:hypothetical protein UFOVP74_25 [uncultured Caudovirales phage]|uniref:Uncharacterized protein n=1 Tax=uncultured Caudovirales phage TaxID=2100421 RepID=A0A6J5KWQ0_9CAUD|nr:hypothetical protein UFOVP74_25 [uncultured Caudovirales phage]